MPKKKSKKELFPNELFADGKEAELPKKKRFSAKIMVWELKAMVSRGMSLAVEQRVPDFGSCAEYIRQLIMKDLNIDEYGNKRQEINS